MDEPWERLRANPCIQLRPGGMAPAASPAWAPRSTLPAGSGWGCHDPGDSHDYVCLQQPMLERGETPLPSWRAQIQPWGGLAEQKEPCNGTILDPTDNGSILVW